MSTATSTDPRTGEVTLRVSITDCAVSETVGTLCYRAPTGAKIDMDEEIGSHAAHNILALLGDAKAEYPKGQSCGYESWHDETEDNVAAMTLGEWNDICCTAISKLTWAEIMYGVDCYESKILDRHGTPVPEYPGMPEQIAVWTLSVSADVDS